MVPEERINLLQNDDIEAAMPINRKTGEKAEIELQETKSNTFNADSGSPCQAHGNGEEDIEALQPILN